ncbi:MAG: hypothetical protein KDA93_23305 [Planctomycetaceae bacterium]|nr:hypothetical protein [Planctomycetaceae bacterium]
MTSPSRSLLKRETLTTIVCGLVFVFTHELVAEIPIRVGEFSQSFHRPYGVDAGLPEHEINAIRTGTDGHIYARAESGGVFRLEEERWSRVENGKDMFEPLSWYDSLASVVESRESVRDVAEDDGEIAVAAKEGLFVGDGTKWELALPQEGDVRWAPVDVRGVTYDASGQLWFAAPQGVGYREKNGQWRLFTGQNGLPYNDFTCIAAGPESVWFGTTNGAIKYVDGQWFFRQGGRWLLDNHVHDIAVDSSGDAWIATSKGVSCIATKPMTLATKAAYYEDEIERYNRRTKFGYVNPAKLSSPGDKSTAKPTYSDNDGFNTGLYLAAVSFGYAATEQPKLEVYAHKAFRALTFLSEVTQGGPHGAPKGFVARNVVPTTEENPNDRYDIEYDIRRNKRDALWKIMEPRVPTDKTGQWYWKCDSSSDELDGHFLGYAVYFDLICETEQEKEPVRQVVRDIIEHLLTHDYSLVDHDGKSTRWAHFSPDDLNRNPAWVAERGMNSYAMLTYLIIAHHITGDQKYRDVYLKLAIDHGYGMNGMSQYKWIPGSHSPGHQPGDNLTFMNYYHLLRYETDPELLSMYYFAINRHWSFEQYERNAFTNFIYAACCRGKIRKDNWGEVDMSPPDECYTDAIDTLKRYPLDLVEWPMSNAHRIDMLPLEGQDREHAEIGSDIHGYAFPIDERNETYWDWDPWELSSNDKGMVLRPGFHYLLAFYMGLYHGFIE